MFQIERVSQDKGLYGPYSVTRAGEIVFFLTPQGLYRVSPGELPVEIGKAKFNRTLMADIDRGNLQLAIGAADPRQSRLLLAYRSVGNSTPFYDKFLCYDYLLDRASIIPIMGEYLFATAQPGITLEGLDTISGSIDALTTSLDSFTNALTPEMAHFDTSHRLYFFRGTPLEAMLDSAEQGTDGTAVAGARLPADHRRARRPTARWFHVKPCRPYPRPPRKPRSTPSGSVRRTSRRAMPAGACAFRPAPTGLMRSGSNLIFRLRVSIDAPGSAVVRKRPRQDRLHHQSALARVECRSPAARPPFRPAARPGWG